uniref:Vitellogenin n=1 Tax=Aleuroglyphus ovatus TaxID=212130 RepID=A0A899IIU0_ALEOV|nr:vitellogenin [Aleuroglyphus ovatus]
MRFSIGLVFSALFVSAVLSAQIAPNQLPIQLMPGQSYIYSYSGRLVSGIAQLDTNAAVLEINSDIVLQPEEDGTKVAMQMTNIRVGKHNGIVSEHLTGRIVIDHQEQREYDQWLSKPIRFLWVNGQVKSFEASAQEPEWSINVKKSILSLLNINLSPAKIIQTERTKQNTIHHRRQAEEQLVVYPIYEDGIGGICETLYEVKQAPYTWSEEYQHGQGQQQQWSEKDMVLNVTKTRVYENCLTQPTLEKTNVDVRGAPVACKDGKPYPVVAGYYPMGAESEYQADATTYGPCTQGQKIQASPVDQFNYVKYNISKKAQQGVAQIESVYGEGKTIFNSNGKQIMVIVQQNITIQQVLPSAEVGHIKQVSNGIVHEELSFRLPKPVDATPLDIPYYHLFGKVNRRELEQLIPEMLNSVAEDLITNEIATNKNTMQKTVELNNAISVLDAETLERIFVKVAQKGRSSRANSQEQIVRKLFIDLIGSAGTTETALLAVRLYQQDQLTTYEAKELFEAIPQNLFIVDLKVVEAYLNLFLSDKVQQQRHLAASVGIAFGKMIHEATVKRQQTPGDIHTEQTVQQQRRAQAFVSQNQNIMMHQQRSQQPQQQGYSRIRRSAPWEQQFQQELLESQQIQKVIEVLREALRQAPTFHQKVTLIETLAHMAIPEVLEILAPYVNDQAAQEELPGYVVEKEEQLAEERNFIRQVTIYALAHVARQYPQQVLALLLPVYENKAEPYEVRIAAFTVLLHCQPAKQILERIGSELHFENNRQVKSFVRSSLETVANSTQPGWKQMAEDARLAIQLAPKDGLGMHYSKMVGQDYYDEEKKFGVNYLAEWVSSNVSQVPRSGYLQVAQSKGPFKNVMLELGYNAKGVDSLLQRLAEPNGIVSDAFEAMNTQTKDRRILRKRSAVDSSAQQALQALKEKLNLVVRSDDEPKATIFMKLFERTSYFALDRHYIHSIIDSAEDTIKDLASSLMTGKSFHYVKLVMPNQLYKVVPSELGLPVVITERHPTILSIKINKAKLQLDMPKQAIIPVGANLTVQVVPTLYHAPYDFVFALTPATNEAVGTHVEKTTRASFPVEFSVGYKRNALSWSIVPTVPQEIVHHHVSAKTFISKATIASSPDRDWLQEAAEIKTKRQPFQSEKQYLKEQLGLGLRVQVQSESPIHSASSFFRTETARKHGIIAAAVEMITATEDITPREVHIALESDAEKQVTGWDFNLRYKRVEDLEGKQTREVTVEEEEEWNTDAQDLAKLNGGNRQAWVWAARAAKAARQSEEQEQMPVSSAPTTEQVWEKIFATKYSRESVKSVAQQLMAQTKPVWSAHWSESELESVERSSEQQRLPAIIAHDVVLTAIARSARPTYYGVNALLVKTFDERAYWLKVNAFARKESIQNYATTKTAQNHQELCFDGLISYPVIPNEFYYEPTATQDLKAKVHARLSFGYDCVAQTGVAAVQINGLLEKTDEKVIRREDLARSSEYPANQPEGWFYQQCAVDRAQGKPLSYAYERAIIEDSYFKQFVFDIEYANIAPEVANWTRKLALATKVALYQHLQVAEALDEQSNLPQNAPNKIRITAQFSTKFAELPLANLYIQSPKENAFFEKIHLRYLRPISALLPVSQVYQNALKSYESVDKCVVMENAIRTFDNVTIRLDQLQSSPCQFLIAKDCSAAEKFAIFARQLDADAKTKAVTVLVAGSEIRLLPPTKSANAAQVVIDGRTVQLHEQSKPQIVAKVAGDIVVYLRASRSEVTEPIVIVKSKAADLTVHYDGKSVKVEAGKQYQGTTCGLCGDNNDEAENEFTGPDACVYQKEQDFVASYALAGQHCEQAPIASGAKRCPAQVTSRSARFQNVISGKYGYVDLKDAQNKARSQELQAQANAEELARLNQKQMESLINRSPVRAQEQFGGYPQYPQQKMPATPNQQQLVQRLRTYFVHQADKVCFSTEPIISCLEGISRPTQYKQQLLNFHCLPAQSISVQRLTMQAQQSVLPQFGRKAVHYSQYVQTPVACIAA